MASFWYTNGLKLCMDGTVDIDTSASVKLMLLETAAAGSDTLVYTPAKTHTAVSSVTTAELNVSGGYTRGYGGSGRKTPLNITMTANQTDLRVDIAIQDQTWTSVASGKRICAAVLIYETGGSDATSYLLAYLDVTNTDTNGGDITLNFADLASGGNLRIAV